MRPDLPVTPATDRRRFGPFTLFALGLALSGCTSNADTLYQGEVLRRDQEAVAGLEDSRRVVVRDPSTQEVREVHELALGGDGEEMRHGVERRYWPEGNLQSYRGFSGGTPVGLWWSWWRTGAIRSAYVYSTSEPTRMTWWHPNGFVSAEGMAINGRRVGPWSYFHGNGALMSQGEMGGGHRIGEWTFYDESGEWTERGRFIAGKRTGDWQFRDQLSGAVPFAERRSGPGELTER